MNRKRKLTWIEKKQIEKMAFDHPFFDIPGSVLSKKEAEAIIRSAEARKSGVEIVSEACDKAGVPRPDFVDNHYTVFENLKEVIAIPAIRRIGIIAIALILLVVFFTATPTGRAIAESVIHYIVTLFNDGRMTVNRSDSEAKLIPIYQVPDSGEEEIQEQENRDIYVNSFEEFITATGVQPMVLSLPYTELYYYHDIYTDYLKLNALYETSKGTVETFQIWNTEPMISVTSSEFAIYDADPSIYYSVEGDGTVTVMKFMEDSIVGIVTKGSFTVNDLIGLLISE